MLKQEQIPLIIDALRRAGAIKIGGIEWVYQNDDEDEVIGPDDKAGWFNDGSLSHAVEAYDPVTVRAVVHMFWITERLRDKDASLDGFDMEALTGFVKFIDQI